MKDNGEPVKHNNGGILTMGVNKAQVKRHVKDVCKKRIEEGSTECEICPFISYVKAFLVEIDK